MTALIAYVSNGAWRIYGGYKVPPPTPKAYRDSLIPGLFMPGVGTSGLYTPQSSLTVQTGNVTFGNNSTNNGTVIENVDFRGLLTFDSVGTELRNCIIRGPQNPIGTVTSFGGAVVRNGSNIKFTDCLVEPTGRRAPALYGRRFNATRCEIRYCEDGVRVISDDVAGARADVVLNSNWVHDLVPFTDSAQSDNITHNDAVQWQGGRGLTMIGNRLEAFYADPAGPAGGGEALNRSVNYVGSSLSMHAIGACLMMNRNGNRDTPDELLMQRNWLNGGAVGINNATGVSNPLTGLSSIVDNHIGYDFRLGQDYLTFGLTGGAFAFSGNTRWGGPAPWVHGTISGSGPYVWTPSHLEDVLDAFDASTAFAIRH